MSDRTVSVRLMAITSQYQAAMAAAGASTKAVAAEVKKTAVSSKADLQTVGTSGVVAGGLLLGGFALATKATMGFDKQLSALSAVSGATAGDMEKLRQAALDAGQATVFSASEAALAETELAKVGISTADIMGGALTGALSLAAAGGIQLADAATIAGQAMKIFKLQGSDVGHVADLLAAGANKSAADVGQLGDALRMGGLVAAQTGLSIEETTAALAVFADNALIGSDAGTSLKTMLLALNPKSAKAASLMHDLGFQAYDAQGKFIGLEALAGELQSSFSGLTDEQRNAAMMTIFGTDAIRAANVLYTEGAAGVAEYATAVNDQGAAQRMASEMTNNLAGDIERLKGSLETALIGTGTESNGVLREMVQALDDVVGGYIALPGPVKGAVGALAGVGGAVLLVGGALSMALPRIVETRAAMATLTTEMPRTTAGMKTAAKGLGVLAAAYAALQVTQAAFHASGSELLRFVEETAAAAGPDTQAKIDGLTKKYEELRAVASAGGVEFWGGGLFWSDEAADAADQADALKERIDQLVSEQKIATIEAKTGATATDAYGDAAEDAADKVDDLTDAVLTQRGAQRSYQAALDDAGAALKKNGKTLDIHTEKGRANAEALDGIATAAKAELDALDASGASADRVSKRHDAMRDALIRTARRFGMNREAAKKYADAVLGIPSRIETTAQFHVVADILRNSAISKMNQAPSRQGRASGGLVTGSGSGTSDSIPMNLSNGEYVMRAAAVRKIGVGTLSAMNAGGTSGGTPALSLTMNVDARGATMTRGEYEQISRKAAGDMLGQLVTQLRAS